VLQGFLAGGEIMRLFWRKALSVYCQILYWPMAALFALQRPDDVFYQRDTFLSNLAQICIVLSFVPSFLTASFGFVVLIFIESMRQSARGKRA
jgi:hypothetical protein